ncbi:chitin deacetylase [Mortierella claussenii]|nr:chitin deacetylase [Mortierella claussenii]
MMIVLTFYDSTLLLGPTPNTPTLLQILKANNVKASFFVMGSNVVKNANVLKQEVAEGHHIASHTWSHHPLTTLSNEQIVAELKWTEKAVMDISGLRMKYMRPPYGDIDNRVRAVVKKLGYIVVDWTSDAYDSKDFNLNAGFTEATLSAAVTTMKNTLTNYGAKPGTKGVITLEHDLYPVTVEFAKRLIPVGAQAKLKVMSIAECLNDAHPYQNDALPPNGNITTSSKPGATDSSGGTGPTVLPNAAENGVSFINKSALIASAVLAIVAMTAY